MLHWVYSPKDELETTVKIKEIPSRYHGLTLNTFEIYFVQIIEMCWAERTLLMLSTALCGYRVTLHKIYAIRMLCTVKQ